MFRAQKELGVTAIRFPVSNLPVIAFATGAFVGARGAGEVSCDSETASPSDGTSRKRTASEAPKATPQTRDRSRGDLPPLEVTLWFESIYMVLDRTMPSPAV